MYFLKSKVPKACHQNRLFLGTTGSGKSTEMIKYLLQFNKFYPNINVRKVIIIAPMFHSAYQPIINMYGRDKCHYFTSLTEDILPLFDEDISPESVCFLVIDDMGVEISKSNLLEKICTTMTRHKYLCVNITFQGLFQFNTPQFKTICRNCSCIVLTNSPRENHSVHILFSHIFGTGGAKKADQVMKQSLEESMKRYNSPYYFIYLNLSTDIDEKLRVIYDMLSDYPLIFY